MNISLTPELKMADEPKKENGRVGRAPLIEAFDAAVE